ncbi:MAG: hypothetical protein OEY23_16715 [Acidimicrobiia bacterium]|nr:hypothetical protein [Acidimicrobiia bacterium]
MNLHPDILRVLANDHRARLQLEAERGRALALGQRLRSRLKPWQRRRHSADHELAA